MELIFFTETKEMIDQYMFCVDMLPFKKSISKELMGCLSMRLPGNSS